MRTTRPKINRRGSRPNSGVHSMSDSTRIPPSHARRALIALFTIVAVLVAVLVVIAPALAQTPAPASSHSGGEASLKIPDLGGIAFSGVPGRTLLMLGLIVCGLGLVFGLVIFNQLKNLPVHASMREISELIYETCKTYLITQGKFILLLEVFIGIIIVVYFGFLQHYDASRVIIILLFSLIGIAETYGVTGVALISFILLAVREPAVQVQLLVWIFLMRVLMIVASGASYLINEAWVRAQYAGVARMNFEAPLTRLVWLTSFVSVAMTYLASWVLGSHRGDGTLWWRLSTVITCGTLAGAIIPELVKIFTSTESIHVKEVVTSSREGGASLNILSGLIAGNF